VEARYGEFVLLRPRLAPHTLLLWLTPLLLLGGAAYALVRRARQRSWVKAGEEPLEDPQAQPLSPAERQRLDALLKRQQG
jgi:cytochrome c-type biogenesis protein CcmH